MHAYLPVRYACPRPLGESPSKPPGGRGRGWRPQAGDRGETGIDPPPSPHPHRPGPFRKKHPRERPPSLLRRAAGQSLGAHRTERQGTSWLRAPWRASLHEERTQKFGSSPRVSPQRECWRSSPGAPEWHARLLPSRDEAAGSDCPHGSRIPFLFGWRRGRRAGVASRAGEAGEASGAASRTARQLGRQDRQGRQGRQGR